MTSTTQDLDFPGKQLTLFRLILLIGSTFRFYYPEPLVLRKDLLDSFFRFEGGAF